MVDSVAPFPLLPAPERESLRTPDDVAEILRLHRLGWGAKRSPREVGCAKNTVKRYLAQGAWGPPKAPVRPGRLDGLTDWPTARFRQHHGNADVVRQDLAREHGILVSLRTVEHAVAPLRQALHAEARATVRYETAPGHQLRIDFGERAVVIAGVRERCYCFVATLGHSRRLQVRVFAHARQTAWLDGLESAFRAFGGVPRTVLVDNVKPLVLRHDPTTREVTFHPRFLAFAQHWGFRPWACAPYRARTKGKDERDVADVRVHGTTGEAPLACFTRDEAHALQPLADRPSFQPMREWTRRVQAYCTIELTRNLYSVPWRLLGETVRVVQRGAELTIHHGGAVVATHAVAPVIRVRRVDPAHLAGISTRALPARAAGPATPALLRPLSEYAAVIGEAVGEAAGEAVGEAA